MVELLRHLHADVYVLWTRIAHEICQSCLQTCESACFTQVWRAFSIDLVFALRSRHGTHCVGGIVFSGSTLVSRLDPCKPLASAALTMDGQSNASHGKGRRHARAGKRRGQAGAGQGKGAPAGKAGASSTSAPAGKAGVQGERLGGQSGKRHQVVYAYPSVPGDGTAGAHILRDSQCRCCAVISGSLNI